MVSRLPDACGRNLDGSVAAPEYYRRRVFYATLQYVVRERHPFGNPLGVTDEPE